MKTCTKCGEKKPETEFPFQKKAIGLRHPRCKACMNAATRKRRGVKEKRCTSCGELKAISKFPWKIRSANRRQARCKTCLNWHARTRYERLSESEKKRFQAQVKQRQVDLLDFVRSIKEGESCVDCDRKFNPWQMDYDHRPDEVKEFNIGAAHLNGVARERILAEIAKCDLVCACCHRDRTHYRRLEEADAA